MSALVRYYLHKGWKVGGYDRVESSLTRELCREGAAIHYDDDPTLIDPDFLRDEALTIYTPAIPADCRERQFLERKGKRLLKRAEVLGKITAEGRALCVAGTHGKTTTTAMLAHIMEESGVGCNAFLGGITKNYGTNYLFDKKSDWFVVEADEFDRSFHQLRPWASVVTATDADHLDVYGTAEEYVEGFAKYTELVSKYLVVHTGLKLVPRPKEGVIVFHYGREGGDFRAANVKAGGGRIVFDLVSPLGNIEGVGLGVPVSINVENGIAAMALAQIAGVGNDEIRHAMRTFEGVERRFDFKIKDEKTVLVSDYAHHPEEIRQAVLSLREVFAGRRLLGIFQPHLYTRTRDFHKDFAASLSLLDEVWLTEIYPARELPIEGVTSRLIYDGLDAGVEKHMVASVDVADRLAKEKTDVVIVLGAGDLDNRMEEFRSVLMAKEEGK